MAEMVQDDTRAPGINFLELHLNSRLGGRIRDLRIEERRGDLILMGRCDTYYAKQLAQHELMDATSDRPIRNEIQVVSR